MSYLYDAIYTLASGLHELLEEQKEPREVLKENGILLRETMQKRATIAQARAKHRSSHLFGSAL